MFFADRLAWFRVLTSGEHGQFQSWHGIDYLLLALTETSGVVDGEDLELLKSGRSFSVPGASVFCGVEVKLALLLSVVNSTADIFYCGRKKARVKRAMLGVSIFLRDRPEELDQSVVSVCDGDVLVL